MKISSIMTENVFTVDMDVTLQDICRIFEDKKFHHLLVVEDGELRGVISDRDVLRALSPFLNTPAEQTRDVATLKKRSHQIMSRDPITIRKDASVKDAIRLMFQKIISCLPVVSSDGRIEGIVTRKDLLDVYSEQLAAKCRPAAVSRPG